VEQSHLRSIEFSKFLVRLAIAAPEHSDAVESEQFRPDRFDRFSWNTVFEVGDPDVRVKSF
jgi:hypothetical protein